MAKAKNELMTLAQEAHFNEMRRHRNRVAELGSMEAKLRLFEDFRPAILAAGIFLAGEELTASGRDMWIGSGWQAERNASLLRVLLEQEMREMDRREYLHHCQVTLRKGRLTVTFLVEMIAEKKAVQS